MVNGRRRVCRVVLGILTSLAIPDPDLTLTLSSLILTLTLIALAEPCISLFADHFYVEVINKIYRCHLQNR